MKVCLDFVTVKVRVPFPGDDGKSIGLVAAEKLLGVIKETCQPVPETLHMQVELWRWNPDKSEQDFLVTVFAEEELLERIEWIQELLMVEGIRESFH